MPVPVTTRISNVPVVASTTSTVLTASETQSPNATLTGSGNTQQSSSAPSNSHTKPTIIASVVAGVGVTVLAALLILLWICLRRRRNRSKEIKSFGVQNGAPAIHGTAQADNERKLHCPSQLRIPSLLFCSGGDVFPLRWPMVLQLCSKFDRQGKM